MKYNSLNLPIARNSHKLASYIGVKVCQHIPIDIENWHKVSKELKNKIWIDIKRAVNLGEDRKHDLLKAAGKQWKAFKTHLTKEYIAKGFTANPPDIYNFIKQENWENFVKIRTSENFKIEERSKNFETLITSINRGELWCLARLKPDGTYNTTTIKEVAERIESLTQLASQGVIHPSGLNDVLTMTIGSD